MTLLRPLRKSSTPCWLTPPVTYHELSAFTLKKKVWLTVAIGLLGSLSAVSTYAAGYLDGQAKQSFGCISEIEKQVRKTVQDIRSESNAALAEQYLGEMERKVARCPA